MTILRYVNTKRVCLTKTKKFLSNVNHYRTIATNDWVSAYGRCKTQMANISCTVLKTNQLFFFGSKCTFTGTLN